MKTTNLNPTTLFVRTLQLLLAATVLISAGTASAATDAEKLSVLNALWYRNHYPDLKNAFPDRIKTMEVQSLGSQRGAKINANEGPDLAAVQNHWLHNGIREGRDSSPNFSIRAYLGRYPDLQKAFGGNFSAALDHWFAYGKREGRNPAPVGAVVSNPATRAECFDRKPAIKNWAQCDLHGANLVGVTFGKHGTYGKLGFKRSTLAGANLTGANLTGVDLTDVDLNGADLSGATYTFPAIPEQKATPAMPAVRNKFMDIPAAPARPGRPYVAAVTVVCAANSIGVCKRPGASVPAPPQASPEVIACAHGLKQSQQQTSTQYQALLKASSSQTEAQKAALQAIGTRLAAQQGMVDDATLTLAQCKEAKTELETFGVTMQQVAAASKEAGLPVNPESLDCRQALQLSHQQLAAQHKAAVQAMGSRLEAQQKMVSNSGMSLLQCKELTAALANERSILQKLLGALPAK